MRQRSQRGFTIMELLITLAVVALLMMMGYSVTAQIAGGKRAVARVSERAHELRVGMNRMVTDISMAYLSQSQPSGVDKPRTFFIGKSSGEYLLQFSYLGHRVMWANANESEQAVVAYFTADDPEEHGTTNLVRRESRRMSYEGWENEPHDTDILIRDIKEVEFEYWDWKDKEWRDDWDSTADTGKRNLLPTRVRIQVTVEDHQGEERVHSTQARIMMQEVLSF